MGDALVSTSADTHARTPTAAGMRTLSLSTVQHHKCGSQRPRVHFSSVPVREIDDQGPCRAVLMIKMRWRGSLKKNPQPCLSAAAAVQCKYHHSLGSRAVVELVAAV